MSNKRRNRRTSKGSRHGILGRSRARTKLAANVTEEQEWYMDSPDVRLTKIFTVVLLLHAVAIGGIIAFKMVDKASATTGITITAAKPEVKEAVQEEKLLSTSIPERAATTSAAPTTPPAQAHPGAYQFQAGDTLAKVAIRHGVSVEALRKANGITSDNEVYPNRWLDIPKKGAAASAPKAVDKPAQRKPEAVSQPSPAAPAQPTSQVYEVKKGDTVWGISRAFEVPVDTLLQSNGITRPDGLQIGQKLQIPGN